MSSYDDQQFNVVITQEHRRLAFLTDRDGIDAAKAFAKRTYKMYRAALFNKKIDRHWAREKEYRFSYVASCIVLRRYV